MKNENSEVNQKKKPKPSKFWEYIQASSLDFQWYDLSEVRADGSRIYLTRDAPPIENQVTIE
jgi:hypothetical protein